MSKIDKNDRLKENPFDYQTLKNGKIMIFYEGKQIMMLNEKDSKKLLNRISNQPDFEVQLALAKITGNFKHGNEKVIKNRDKI